MSTKTLRKRIALVAVSALSFGLLSSVPAIAGAGDASVTAISAGTPGIARVGVASNTTITLTVPATTSGIDLSAQISSAPALSAAARLSLAVGTAASIGTNVSSTVTASNMGIIGATGIASGVVVAGAAATSTVTVALTPDVAGTYTVLVSVGGTPAGGFQAGNRTASFTVTTRGTPTSITVSSLGQVVEGAPANFGARMSVTLKDTDGNTTILGQSEAINVTTTNTNTSLTDGNGAARTFLSSPSSSGSYTVFAEDTGAISANGTAIITFTGAGSLPATLNTNTSVSVIDAVATPTAPTFGITASTTNYSGTGATRYTATRSSHPFTFDSAVSTDTTVGILVQSTGLSTVRYATSVVVPAADDTVAFSVSQALTTATLGASALNVSYVSGGAATGTVTITYDAPVANRITAVGQTNILLPTAGSVPLTVTIIDQFGNAVANSPVTVAASGRTTVATTALGVTNSLGQISYTFTDSGTSGSSNTVTFGATLAEGTGTSTRTPGDAAAFSIVYGTATVGTVSVTGGNTTAGVTAATPTLRDINAGATGVQATIYGFSATVRDANGNLAIGVPVTWTVSGTGAAVLSTTASTYTNGSGVASASVYGWIAGTYTVTATAGGKTGTGTITFAQTAAGEERVLSATVNGPVVTAKVVDRFGNVVPNVTIWATETGAGYFGNGVTRTSSTTDANGTADFIITGGDASVTLYTYNPATAGAVGSGQSCARAGAADCGATAADDTAFTAAAAGTALVAEKGVGASFAPAGVSTVTVTTTGVNTAADNAQASADAAAEATDAANAATDAANAAAEAADAATAAAQDAADAVAALATQVNEQISELKAMNMALQKQITALTNLIIKIQKKVKA
ncbi:MAG: hypothetical protein EBU12_05555 [Microbacteriaceae bacterium]|nr:hypothetical protein [Microbacteriaceae bacterium]